MRPRQTLAFGLLALSLSACSSLGRPSVTPESPSVTGVSRSGLELGVQLHVDNPNPFPLVANDVKGTLFLDETKEVGTSSASLDSPIAAKGSGIIQSELDIAWSSVGALREFIGRSQVPYTFKGELGFSGGPVKLSVPFELRGQLSRDQLLAVAGGLLSPLLK